MQCPMDAKNSEASAAIEIQNIVTKTISDSSSSSPPASSDRSPRHCYGNEATEQPPLTANPSILLHVLSSYGLEPKDLAALEATCKFFRNPANFMPDPALPLPEVAAFDTCGQKAMFKLMKDQEKERLKQRCGGSWKLVLGYLLIGEKNYRREKPQVIAGPGHSIAVTAKGDVYSFGSNNSGQLGLGNTEDQSKPCIIKSLQGIRIIQAAVGSRRTMLVSDTGSVYTFGQDIFGGLVYDATADVNYTSSPKLVESLKDIFVVQASIGGYFSAVLTREGQVYTFSWGRDKRLGHESDVTDVEPRLISGPLEDVLVVQIAAGNCYLLILAYQPTGMSIYSVGCGLGGKLGHGSRITEGIPRSIEHFQQQGIKPLSISAGAFHASVLASDGRVFTWGWSNYGCLGHGGVEECITLPTAVEGLAGVKAVHVSAGDYTTFVVADNGDVYSFGWGTSFNLGVQGEGAENADVPTPKLVTSLDMLDEKVAQISATNTWDWPNGDVQAHTFVLTESGKLYSFGGGRKGQLGVKLAAGEETMQSPARVAIDLI
ncbi:hypothetical protein ACP70R_011431 [Stipagrostis hirtigluma subsp. patula]